MALNLVAEGGTVVGIYAKSQDDADELIMASHALPGRLIMKRGDASDLKWCVALKNQLRDELHGLDLLVCNAVPAIQALRLEEASYERIHEYVNKGFALVAAPLSSFLELVSSSEGRVLMISSSAVDDPPPIWPQYVAVKAAAEGLVRTAAAANSKVSFWIARPGSMLTDLVDTPLGRLDAEMPQAVAKRILGQVCGEPASTTVQFCR
jgi:NAD(P)-dependent dehydrogenase (short-subunit alcohol dehydrogenase family)